MPSRKLTDRCHGCGCKNHLRARYCNQCGHKLDEDRATRDADGRAKLHADIAHPINSACREVIQGAVLKAYNEERERSKQPGYICTYDDYDAEFDETFGSVVGELNAANRSEGYRTHAAHSQRGSHHGHAASHENKSSVAANNDERRSENTSFGAGIL
jgi:stage V sporulation protein G